MRARMGIFGPAAIIDKICAETRRFRVCLPIRPTSNGPYDLASAIICSYFYSQ